MESIVLSLLLSLFSAVYCCVEDVFSGSIAVILREILRDTRLATRHV